MDDGVMKDPPFIRPLPKNEKMGAMHRFIKESTCALRNVSHSHWQKKWNWIKWEKYLSTCFYTKQDIRTVECSYKCVCEWVRERGNEGDKGGLICQGRSLSPAKQKFHGYYRRIEQRYFSTSYKSLVAVLLPCTPDISDIKIQFAITL